MCKAGALVGNPILPATAEKYRAEEDLSDGGPSPLTFGRIYRSTWAADAARLSTGLGAGWTHNHSMALKAMPVAAPTAVAVTTAEGYVRSFTKPLAASSWTATNSADRLVPSGGGWLYTRADDDTTFAFDAAGKRLSQTARNGWVTRYAYNATGQLASVTNAFGRSLVLAYNTAGQLLSVTAPGARSMNYAYDAAGRLASARYPDSRIRTFLYENTAFPKALTGLLDENGARYATFVYDAQGRAISTELAGAAERYQVSYPFTGFAFVTDPLGTQRSFGFGNAANKLAVTSGSLPAGTGSAADEAKNRVQDANGLVTREVDFKDVATTTIWDTARRLPLTVTRAAGTSEARSVTTQWHPTFALPVLVTETGRTTSFTYDAQGRPLSQTVTHVAPSPAKAQTTRWTYNLQGLAATETAPNGAVTSYLYDAAGNPTQSTNALGHITRYTWDAANRLVGQTAPNGLATTYTWDTRDRMLTQTVGGQQTTRYTYTTSGEIATLTQPSGLVFTYTYDAAHRLTGWSNNRGESSTYALDGMGNRVSEQIKNATGAIAWSTARSVNNINRLATDTVGGSQSRSFGYDANGERIAETDALNQSTRYGLDALRRVTVFTDAVNATAKRSYNALDDVVQATDFKGVVTGYTRDAQGNATAETGIDAGNRSTQYDALGLPSKIVDALGQAIVIVRDALGRPTQFTYADGKTATLRYDLAGAAYNAAGSADASRGYLSELQDRSGTTVYQRDVFGRVVRKTQTLASGMSRSLATSYTTAGLVDTVVYPGAADQTLRHVYDATGRLVRMDWRGQPLITGIAWTPLGQPAGWTWAGAGTAGSVNVATTRTYDTAGRLTQVNAGGQTVLTYQYDAAGRVSSLSQMLTSPVNAADPNTAVTTALRTWLAGYSITGRLVSFNQSGTVPATASTSAFTYDANGNRTASTQVQGTQTTARTYALGANRVNGFTQTLAGVSSSVAYAYNANGDLLNDGQRSYAYDAEGRLSTVTTGATTTSPTVRYAHNALGQRVFKTEPLYPTAQMTAGTPAIAAFFAKPWSPAATPAEMLGFGYVYDEQGSLIGEYGAGGARSAGSRQYVWLPTASGPMPVATIKDAAVFAVTPDHLNTPRRLSSSSGALVWQWGYSAFGDEAPTVATRKFAKVAAVDGDVEFNLRYPGQYFDKESGLHYNGFRTYNAATGRYTQGDPIGLDGGWNRFGYVGGNPFNFIDPLGLYTEVTVWNGVGIGSSSFGHVSTNINGANYSWGPGGWDTQASSATQYNSRQQEFRGGTGTMLNLSPQQEAKLSSCLKTSSGKYNAITNNCGASVQQCLKAVGVDVGNSVLPSTILESLRSSPAANGSVSYPSPRPKSGFGETPLWR